MKETIIFVGNKYKGNFVNEVADARGYKYINIEEKGDIKEQINDIGFIIKSEKIPFMIFDIEQYNNNAKEIVQHIKLLEETSNATIICYMADFIPDSIMARELIASDLKRFILSGDATSLKDQLEKNMLSLDITEQKAIQEYIEKEASIEPVKNFKSVGIVGITEKTGTTTQAIQIIKYLQFKGYKACYVDYSGNKYLSHIKGTKELSFPELVGEWFTSDKNEDEGYITYKGVDMYYKPEQLPKDKNYDYFIFDYGTITKKQFNRSAFLRENLKFVVGSTFVTELDNLYQFFQNPFYQNINFIISFVPDEDKAEVTELVGGLAGEEINTFFAETVFEPFKLNEIDLFETAIPIDAVETASENKVKKRGFFRKKEVMDFE